MVAVISVEFVEVLEFLIVEFLDALEVLTQQLEVEADLALHETSVEQKEKLGLNSAVEVELEFRAGVAIDHEVRGLAELGSEFEVIGHDFLALGVP